MATYERVLIASDVQDYLADILRKLDNNYNFGIRQNWDVWDYSDDSNNKERLIFEWRTESIDDIQNIYSISRANRNTTILENLDLIKAYYVRYFDNSGNMIVAAKRPMSIKSLRRPIFTFQNNTLTIPDQKFFKLADDFDFMADDNNAFIFSPNGFEAIVDLDSHISNGIAANAAIICSNCPMIFWPDLQTFASTSKRAAKILRSIVIRGEYTHFDTAAIKRELLSRGIQFVETPSGQLVPASDHELNFLRLLDHSIYGVKLTPNPETNYIASSRVKL